MKERGVYKKHLVAAGELKFEKIVSEYKGEKQLESFLKSNIIS